MATEVPPKKTPEQKERRRVPSLVLVHTGNGKGKSSSAFGVVIRSVARNWNVAVIQFLKSGNWNTGEERVCREKLGVDWWAIGEGFSWESEDLSKDEAVAQVAWAHAKNCISSGEYQLVVLDEVTYPANWGWISKEELVSEVIGRPKQTNIVITGRDAPAEFVEIADTVTEMRNVKHAYERGIVAKKGIDY
tara:strand:+ start:1300 stop:1872 length:573 start_codon:yes stop_codon:yes gene_type:complete